MTARLPTCINQDGETYLRETYAEKNLHQTITLNPMPSDERRIIHGALSGYHNIKTESKGQGKDRRLTIYYVEE